MRHPLKSFLLIIFLSAATGLSAQSSNTHKNAPVCHPNYDSTQAVELILSKYDTARMPVAEFNKNTCEWSVTFFTAAYTRKGNCKNTNGCTILRTYEAIVDARTGKTKVEMTGTKTFANWE
jgi:hypothetical protein